MRDINLSRKRDKLGKERDNETNYDYFSRTRDKGARYGIYPAKSGYSTIGRWLQVDPLADKYPGWSPYSYASNNPIIYYDDNGDSTRMDQNKQYVVDPVVVTAQREYIAPIVVIAQAIPSPFFDPWDIFIPIPSPPSDLNTANKTGEGVRQFLEGLNNISNIVKLGAMVLVTKAVEEIIPNQFNEGTEETPKSNPEKFKAIKGSRAKENVKTGEVWEKDLSRHGGEHWEVYKNKRDYENRNRDRQVWEDGRVGKRYK